MIWATSESRDAAADPQSPLVFHVMTPGVLQIPGDVSVREAAALMQKEHVPCLLIKDSDSRLGIVTHADLVHKVVARGLNPGAVVVRTIMSRPVHAIEFDQSVTTATTLMAAKGIPLLIVTKRRRPIGVLTARDMVFSPTRDETRITVSLKVQGGHLNGTEHVATISRLTQLGAFVETPAPLPAGTSLRLSFWLPRTSCPIVVEGTVLSSRDQDCKPAAEQTMLRPGMGVKFANLSADDESLITAWIVRTQYKQSGEV